MIRHLPAPGMGHSELGWLHSLFHFSFADYYHPDRTRFGVLRVLNDDLVEPGTGFNLHPHRDMEILSYVVQGQITHQDSLGHGSTLGRGEVQYMSAGTGVFHSEHNRGHDLLRLLQIWIVPSRRGLAPRYGEYRFAWEDRRDRWLHLAGGPQSAAPISIQQDANLYALELGPGQTQSLTVAPHRQAYLVLIEGTAQVQGSLSLEMAERDALEITGEDVLLRSQGTAHFLAIEMPRDPSFEGAETRP